MTYTYNSPLGKNTTGENSCCLGKRGYWLEDISESVSSYLLIH